MYSKRFAAALMAALCAFGAVSCGKKDSTVDEKKEAETTAATDAAETTEADTTKAEEDSDDKKEDSGSDDGIKLADYLTVDKTSPAMWKVTDRETGNVLYMLGTIHIVTEDTFPLPDYIMDVYKNCDGIAVELDINSLMSDMQQMQEFASKLMYTDGSTVKEHISAETYEKLKTYMSENYIYNEMMDGYTAGYWVSQLESLAIMNIDDLDTNGVDSRFIEMANNDKKEVISLETIDIQTRALSAASDDLADYLISEMIDEAGDMPSYTKDFAEEYDKWASGSIDELDLENDAEELPDDLKDDYAEYEKIILYNRNEGMAAKAEEFLKNGKNYFFMVGAAHFAGEKGVDDLLAAKGYKVERVSA
ncbi:MAG: TraB/GumN family protein [Ruminococcus sp.]|uniref:TraB/GumN family protein n=1 Tax=Ruminococcus sp. TaxID=41978 RepID=UPI00260129B3|nr:TraB/GumN family protein [Ruminococcus sp.]MCR5601567.1 TraB/GumN family protein [Ruminococcus sp.]